MPSKESLAIGSLYREWGGRMAANPEMDIATIRDMYDSWGRYAAEPEDVTYRTEIVGGVEGLWVLPRSAISNSAILYAHGGGFIGGSANGHRKLAGHVARATNVQTFVYNYRLAPENSFPAQLEDSLAVWNAIVARGVPAGRVGLVGDSAGAAVITSLALKLRDLPGDQPGAVVAISPFYDLEATGETISSNAAIDFLASAEQIAMIGQLLLGKDGSLDDPYVLPLSASLSGLPPFYLTAGGDEMLLDDARRFARAAELQGVDVTLDVTPGMQHVFQAMAGYAPEADESIARIGQFLKGRIGH